MTKRHSHLRTTIKWALAFGALSGAVTLTLFATQRSIVFQPDRSRPDVAAVRVPGLREVTITTASGITLLAWWLPPPAGDAATVLYFHGNAGNLSNRAGRMRSLAAAGLGVLMPEYPGYGGNPGTPTEESLFEAAAAAMAFLDANQVGRSHLAVYGESLGTGVAAKVAADGQVAGLVLESPFTSIADMARQRFWFLPVDLLVRDRFDTASRIDRVKAPVMVAIGEQDRLVPPSMGRSLLARSAAARSTMLWVAPEGTHDDLARYGVMEAAIDFTNRSAMEPWVEEPR